MDDYKEDKPIVDQIQPQILDLLLDVVLEVMQAERGSIMLLDDKQQELSIKTSRGLKNEIVQKARVCLGNGVAGKFAANGQPLFLKGIEGDRRLDIKPGDLINPKIDTAYIAPIKFHSGTLGVINVNSSHPEHEIQPEKEHLVQEILHRFSEYLVQVELPLDHHETPSQLYMMNIFREYSTLRELRGVFDYIFHLLSEILKTKEKGFFLLKNKESGFFDLVLGYGLETKNYREVYEELIPQFNEPNIESIRNITILNRKDLSLPLTSFFPEDVLVLMPLRLGDSVKGQILFLVDEPPSLDKTTTNLVQTVCDTAAKSIEESISCQKFRELSFTDSLTGTYNYGLWWRRLHEEFSRAQRQKDTNISLVLLDIDKFNRINLSHGYFVGDQLLRIVADRIKNCLRPTDVLGRIGGGEFGIVLYGTNKQYAINVTNRIVEAVSGISTEMRIKLSHPITFSCGIAEFPLDADTPGDLVEKTKSALVSAKIMGGNRIKLFEQLEE